jgi:L-iditol 2-dehydrogenase
MVLKKETDFMRVAMYYHNQDVRVEEMPIPAVGPGEILVRVEACGICGSDVLEWYRRRKAPLVLGHEIAGEIVECGEGVRSCHKGDRVAVAHHVPCNQCYYCLKGNHTVCDTLRQTNVDPGGFAEFLRVPALNVAYGLFLLSEEISFEEATFIEPLACVLRGQKKVRLEPGESVLVIGSGIAGLLHIQLARALGATRVIATDIVEYRLQAGLRFGADHIFTADEYTPQRLRQVNQGRLADVVLVCTGAKVAIHQALKSVERGGRILLFAPTEPECTIPISINEVFFRNDIIMTTSYAGSPADYMVARDLIQTQRISVQEMITHRQSLDEIALGFRIVATATESVKVLIEPQKK